MPELGIGSIVSWRLHVANGLPNRYEIIASMELPYPGLEASPFHQPTRVNPGFDFLLRHLTGDNQFHPFKHAMRDDLELIPE
jgi:hypothetical protein